MPLNNGWQVKKQGKTAWRNTEPDDPLRKCLVELSPPPVIVRRMSSFDDIVREALANPQNQGEIPDADAVGTVGSPECGDMLRMWLKFTEKDGRRVIDRASFQAFGCQTAIAVASMATELLKGKTPEEAKQLGARELASGLGALPPMKIHCGQLVEDALRNALDNSAAAEPSSAMAPTLASDLNRQTTGKIRIIPID
jgi:nitrogen fixation protein NifU and related proteins